MCSPHLGALFGFPQKQSLRQGPGRGSLFGGKLVSWGDCNKVPQTLGGLKQQKFREFPGGPVVRTLHFHCCGPGLIPGWGTKIPQATQHGQKKKKEKLMLLQFWRPGVQDAGVGRLGSWRL